jgi:hypothetical protein
MRAACSFSRCYLMWSEVSLSPYGSVLRCSSVTNKQCQVLWWSCRWGETVSIAATNGPVVHPPGDVWAWSPGGTILTGETEELVEKLVLVSHSPPQISHGLTQERSRAPAFERPATYSTILCNLSQVQIYSLHCSETPSIHVFPSNRKTKFQTPPPPQKVKKVYYVLINYNINSN